MSEKPWTFEPFEIDEQSTWLIYDENLARIVATFYDRQEANAYLVWRNKKQARRKARRAAKVRRLAGWGLAHPEDLDDLDDDGRC